MTRLRMVMAGALLCGGALLGVAVSAQDASQPAATFDEKKLVAGEKEAKRMLLLMDTDKSGKVSRKEFMTFMEIEFERLDVNKDGELDVKELTQSQVRVVRGRSR